MKKLRYFCTLLLLAVVSGGFAQTEKTTTYEFTAKNWTATVGGNAANWTSGKDGNQFQNGRGIQVTAGTSGANGTSPTSFENVSKIVITYSTNASKGKGTIKVQVGTNSEKSFSVTPVGTSDTNTTFEYDTYETGNVKITVDCTENSIYIKSVAITTTTGSSTDPTITVDPEMVNVSHEAGSDILALAYSNFEVTGASDFNIMFCDAEGNELQSVFTTFSGAKKRAPKTNTDNWLTAEVVADPTGATNSYVVNYSVTENTAATPRTEYFKVKVGDVESNVVTVTQAAYVPTYVVSFNLDGGSFVGNDNFNEEIVEIEAGTYALPSATKDGYNFNGWNNGQETYKAGANYTVADDVEFTAMWTEKGNEKWVLTDITDLTEDDVFVIVGTRSDETYAGDYAMTNNNGTTSAPAAVAVTIEDDVLTSEVADNIKWNISGDATEGYTFYPDGDAEKWLYCTNTNNGVRVGTNDNSTFTVSEEGYLTHSGTSRNVGIYNAQDWRCYARTNAGAIANNIKEQEFAFYKRIETVTVTIKEGFTATTFSSDKALDFTGMDITANIITDEKGSTTQVNVVPAGVGLYIEGAEGEYEVPVAAADAETDDVEGNLLVATAALPSESILSGDAVTYYAFGKQNGKEAFYKVSTTARYTPSANKAVLAVNQSAGSAPQAIVIGGDVTGIDTVGVRSQESGAIYNLQGQRVNKAQKGVFIQKGRKVVVK